MSRPQIAPYGTWRSPITSELIVSETIGLGQIILDGADTYWVEQRPAEGGRNVLVRRAPDGSQSDVTPPPFNVRTRVHEYGGGAFVVDQGTVYFCHFADQRIYRQDPGSIPQAITPAGALRYADLVVDSAHGRILCVREDHSRAGTEPVNTLVNLDISGAREAQTLVSGNAFYASPRISLDGSRLSWLTWNHPNMPWDGTELWIGDLMPDGTLSNRRKIAGGREESIFQPAWSQEGLLYFVSDRNGWWNPYRWVEGRVESLVEMEAEFGQAQWVFGMSTYAITQGGELLLSYTRQGIWHLAKFNATTREFTPLDKTYSDIAFLTAQPSRAVFVAASPYEAPAIVEFNPNSYATQVVRRSSNIPLDVDFISTPRPLEFPTEDGRTAHAFFYPPANADFTGPGDERPPLLVKSHGGPTASTTSALNLDTQYWTSRGFAVLDVNYGGSTGYGRAYRRRLDGAWGVVDVADCINGARHLVEQGEVDGARLAIRGGSAGGYTTLCALTFQDIFKAGASYYGVSDLEALAQDTHKFEARYLDRLIGPYPARIDLYRARSPIHYTEHLSCPVIFFQGREDKVVPPNQAEAMVSALRAKGLPVAYLAFDGEQHGLRQAQNIKRALDAELYFYGCVFGFKPADPLDPVEIANLVRGD
jgi:Dipeptidyl aminopeptidases/acylaminoacyl-peptidases